MKKDVIIKKLTSRKFWLSVVGLITGILILCNVPAGTVESIGALILTAGSIIGYVFGETITDVARAKGDDDSTES